MAGWTPEKAQAVKAAFYEFLQFVDLLIDLRMSLGNVVVVFIDFL